MKKSIKRKVKFYSRFGCDSWAYVNIVSPFNGWISQRSYKSLLKRMGLDRDNYHWAYQLRISGEEDVNEVRIFNDKGDCIGWIS